MKFNKKT